MAELPLSSATLKQRQPAATRTVLIYFRVPLRWSDVLTRTVSEIGDDNCLGLAAQLAFYFFLALFPALLFLVALVGYLPIEDTLTAMLSALATG